MKVRAHKRRTESRPEAVTGALWSYVPPQPDCSRIVSLTAAPAGWRARFTSLEKLTLSRDVIAWALLADGCVIGLVAAQNRDNSITGVEDDSICAAVPVMRSDRVLDREWDVFASVRFEFDAAQPSEGLIE